MEILEAIPEGLEEHLKIYEMLNEITESDVERISKYIEKHVDKSDFRIIIDMIDGYAFARFKNIIPYAKIIQILLQNNFFKFEDYYLIGSYRKNRHILYYLYKFGALSTKQIISLFPTDPGLYQYFPSIEGIKMEYPVKDSQLITEIEFLIENYYPKGSMGYYFIKDDLDSVLKIQGDHPFQSLKPQFLETAFPQHSYVQKGYLALLFESKRIIEYFGYKYVEVNGSNFSMLNTLWRSEEYYIYMQKFKEVKEYHQKKIPYALEARNLPAVLKYAEIYRKKNSKAKIDLHTIQKSNIFSNSVSLYNAIKDVIDFNDIFSSCAISASNLVFDAALKECKYFLDIAIVYSEALVSNNDYIVKKLDKYIGVTNLYLDDAVKGGRLDIVKKYAEVYEIKMTTNLINIAIINFRNEIAKYILGRSEFKSKSSLKGSSLLSSAVCHGNREMIKILVLDFHMDVNGTTSTGENFLMKAVKNQDLDIIKIFVENGAKINNRTEELKMTALMMAAESGNVDITKYLLENGANATLKDRFGVTAIEYSMNNDKISKLFHSYIPEKDYAKFLKYGSERYYLTSERRLSFDWEL